MNIIETIAPISIENLKKHFTDKEVFYLIDYKNSELKGKKLLTYLSNLDLPADIKEPDLELVKEYLHSVTLVNIESLENIIIDILLEYKNILKTKNYKNFINENSDIISKWSDKLDSLSIFNMYIVNSDEFKDYAKTFPADDTNSLEGVNFVSLLKQERFYLFFNKLNNNIRFYTRYFDDYMFRGKNLFEFWSTPKNPMFLLTWGITQGKGQEYIEAKIKDKEIIKNVASI
jgi:hypothetical protein